MSTVSKSQLAKLLLLEAKIEEAGLTVDQALSRIAPASKWTVQAALTEFIGHKYVKGLSPSTISGYEAKTKPLLKWGSQPLSFLRASHIEEILQNREDVSYNSYLRTIKVAFAWWKKKKMIHDNPAEELDFKRVVSAPKLFTVEETKQILRLAYEKHRHFLGYLALGFFAGIRPATIKRLSWENIREDSIVVGKGQGKTYKAFATQIRDNLRPWLGLVEGQPFGPRNWSNHWGAWVEDLGYWKQDGARHSFASYLLALTNDPSHVASQLHHTSTSLLWSTYCHLTTKEEAEEYFKLIPENVL